MDAAAWRVGGPPHESAVQPKNKNKNQLLCLRRSETLLLLCSKSLSSVQRSTMPCCARARLFTLIDTKNWRCAPQSPAVVPRPSLCNCLPVRFTILCIKKIYVKSQFGKNPRTSKKASAAGEPARQRRKQPAKRPAARRAGRPGP